MKKLTEKEEKMLERYQRCSTALNGFILLKASAMASNKLIRVLEETFERRNLTTRDYIFLKLLAEKRAKNFSSLSGSNGTIMIFTKLKDAAFEGIKLEET